MPGGIERTRMALTIEVAGRSDVGCIRKNNEDNFGFDSRHGIFVVCDGMGGQAAGEVASKLAVDTVLRYFREAADRQSPESASPVLEGSAIEQQLSNAIHLANKAVFEDASKNTMRTGMGATVVAVHLGREGTFSTANVGDSRIYRIRNGAIEQLTQDHSLVMEQVRRGLITPEEARHSEVQNIIIRALGAEADVKPDIDEQSAHPGDVLLLCSDGLTREVEDDTIAAIVSRYSDQSLQTACDELIETAKAHGGGDNITALLVRFAERPWYQSLIEKIKGEHPKWQDSI